MTRKVEIFRHSDVADVMSHLACLPKREKEQDDSMSMPEIFREKSYMSEIKGALKKGYTFDDLAKIFSDRCSVVISGRQLKYHYTRAKNLGMKEKSGGKSKSVNTPKDAESVMERNTRETDSRENSPPEYPDFVSRNSAVNKTKFDAFPGGMEAK